MKRAFIWGLMLVLLAPAAARAEAPSPEQWIDWGQRVHGGFGVLIATGIRIGLDAQARLGGERRQFDVTYHHSPLAPCPCIIDGLIVALSASPGQRTLRIAEAPAAPGLYAEILITQRQTGEQLRYCILPEQMARLDEIQRNRDFRYRYGRVMEFALEELASLSESAEACPVPR